MLFWHCAESCYIIESDHCSWVSEVRNGFNTFRIRSWSSTTPSSLPVAWAIRFPATRFPTSIEAGPTSTVDGRNNQARAVTYYNINIKLNSHRTVLVILLPCCLRWPTWLFLAWFGEIGDTGVWAHEDVTRVQVSLQKVLLGFTDVDASEWRFREGVSWDERKAEQAHLVDTIDGLCREHTIMFHCETVVLRLCKLETQVLLFHPSWF